MPTLGQIMRSEIGDDRFRASDAFEHREERVTAMRLATGAPCAGHGAMFAPWPGPETDVERWFVLESGRACRARRAIAGCRERRVMPDCTCANALIHDSDRIMLKARASRPLG